MPDSVLLDTEGDRLAQGLAAAAAALEGGDLPGALAIYSQLRMAFPRSPAPFRMAAAAFLASDDPEEAELLLDAARTRFPGDAEVAADYARVARHRNDPVRAGGTGSDPAANVPARVPADRAASANHPPPPPPPPAAPAKPPLGPLIDRAWAAHHARDWETALRCWSDARTYHPAHPAGFCSAISTLRHSGDLEAAEAMAQEALARFPDEPMAAVEHAWNAMARHDAAQAENRWQAVRERFPTQWVGYTGGAVALRDQQRLAEADALLRTAIERFPDQPGPLSEHAWLAAVRRDWPEAARRWDAVLQRFPDQPGGYTGRAMALRETQRFDDADAVLRTAIERFPDDAGPLVDFAGVAQARRDWAAAAQRWEQVRARFPDIPAGYTAAAQALRELHREGDAEALLAQAAERFPNDPAPAIEAAWLVTHRRDWPRAEALWSALRRRFPHHIGSHHGAALALRELRRYDEAEVVLAEARQRFPNDATPLIEQAWLSQIRRDWPEAIRRWAEVRERRPDMAQAYVQPARALCELWRHDEAEALLADAMARLEAAPELATQFAWVAFQQGRFDEAAARFAAVRSAFPHVPDGWLGGASTLRDQFRLSDAEELLQQGMRHCPDHPQFLLDYAQLPIVPVFAEQKNWPETLRRMEQLRARFPDFLPGSVLGVRLLRQAGQAEAAEALAEASCARHPDNADVALEFARSAEDRGDWPDALRRYTHVRERFPDEPGAAVGLARALAATGHAEAAEAALHDAMARFPSFADPFAAFAQLAVDRQDWAEALRRWTDAQQRFPAQKDFAHRVFDARMRLAEQEPAVHERAAFAMLDAAPKPETGSTDPQVRELAMQFESLGGRGLGCEFGIFQRDCGAEPLDLLRWADMPYDKLVEALESRFAGVGTPDHTELFVTAIGGGRGEYCTRDRRDMMFMRAFIYEDEMPFDKMFSASCRRLQFLTRKLIDDLEQGSKIFVFRLTDRDLEPAEIDRLHRAMRRYGDNTLLYVRYEDAEHPNGTVELVRPGLMIGYMDRFKISRTDKLSAAPPTASWLAVCRAAYALWRADGAPIAAHAPDAASGAVATAVEAAQPAGPPAAPFLASRPPAVLVICGHHNAQQFGEIVQRLPALRERIAIRTIGPNASAETQRERVAPALLESAVAYWEESQAGHTETKQRLRDGLGAQCDVRTFPVVRCTALWPFLGPDPRLVPDPPLYNGGRYPFTDRIAASLAGQDMPDDALFDAYMDLCAAAIPDLDAAFAADLAGWRTLDELYDVQVADFIADGFRADRVFCAPNVRGPALTRHMAWQLLNTPAVRDLCDGAVLAEQLQRMFVGFVGARQELPVHPAVARHFGLRWWHADMRYRVQNDRPTFRDYTLDYIRWRPWLP